jgi:hypothetical protein
MDKQKKLARLQKKESNLVYRGKKAVDEGREKRADRLLKRAAKVENRVIKTSEKMKDGGPTGKQKRLEKRELKAYDKYTKARETGSQKTGKLYDKLVDKQTKSIMSGVNTQYKRKGGSIKTKKK